MRLIVATTNAGKRREIESMLAPLGIAVVPIEEAPPIDVVEDAPDFLGNARKKAHAYAKRYRLPALADDSGLEVEALGGAPGVRSARFAGEGATDAENNALLLRLLEGKENRKARFVCALCLAFPDGGEITAIGTVEGEILPAARGENGFGYDPVFYCPELQKSFGETSPEEKARVSHRARALRALVQQLQKEEKKP